MKIFLFLVTCLLVVIYGHSQTTQELYVSTDGNDTNMGTKELPFASLAKARDVVRTLNKNMKNDLVVYLRGGIYYIKETLLFTEEDRATNGYFIRYMAYNGENPVISGGIQVKNWESYEGNIFKASLDSKKKLRQLYVNGKRCYMAKGKSIGQIDGKPWGQFSIQGNEAWADGAGKTPDGVLFSNKTNLPLFQNPELVEIHSQSGFAYHIVGISNIFSTAEGNVAQFQQPMGAIAANTPEQWGCGFYKNLYGPERLFHFENAKELLDAPSEFYFDVNAKELYYFKQAEEDMATAEVYVPLSEGLLSFKGQSNTSHVKNIEFSGITFECDHWSLVDVAGSKGASAVQSVPLQVRYFPGGNYHDAKYKNLRTQQAAVILENADHIDFKENTFRHLGAMAINIGNDASDCNITCNVFNDLGSAAINVGDARNTYIGDGDIEPGKEGIAKNILISNNSIINACREYLAAPAISVLWAENCEITHNEIFNTPYSAISVGWGWTNFAGYGPNPASTVAKNNKINYNSIKLSDLLMHDGGGIYTLGAQPGGEIIGNYISRVVCPTSGNAIYLDQATSGFKIQDNVSEKFSGSWLFIWGKDAQVKKLVVKNNYADKVTGAEINNAWESVETVTYSQLNANTNSIIVNAGLEGVCRKLTSSNNQKIVKDTVYSDLKIYPNPSKGKFSIQSKNSWDKFLVFNVCGTLVMDKQSFINTIDFDMTSFPRGIYLVEMQNRKNGYELKKVILN